MNLRRWSGGGDPRLYTCARMLPPSGIVWPDPPGPASLSVPRVNAAIIAGIPKGGRGRRRTSNGTGARVGAVPSRPLHRSHMIENLPNFSVQLMRAGLSPIGKIVLGVSLSSSNIKVLAVKISQMLRSYCTDFKR
jgi:hypothetical protein